jgi:hypothetical protein
MNGAGPHTDAPRLRSVLTRLAAMTLGEQVVAALLGGAALLLVELRFEHREALGETWRAWLPLGYLAVLLVAGSTALARFHRGGRRVLVTLFGLALALGALGMWFHSQGHPVHALGQIVDAWLSRPGSDAGVQIGSAPPVLAPAAFIGVGILGLISCLRK